MPRVTRPIPDPTDSEDLDHDQTQGGDEGTPHDHANPGDTQPPEEHGDTEHDDTVPSQSDVSDIQASSDVEHDDTSGGAVSDAHHPRYTDSEASTAAPVQSVNGQAGDVDVDSFPANVVFNDDPFIADGSRFDVDPMTGQTAPHFISILHPEDGWSTGFWGDAWFGLVYSEGGGDWDKTEFTSSNQFTVSPGSADPLQIANDGSSANIQITIWRWA